MADLTGDLRTTEPVNYRQGREDAARWTAMHDRGQMRVAEADARRLADECSTDDLRANMLGFADRLAEELNT